MVRPALALALTALVLAGCTRTDWHEPPARTDTLTASPTSAPTTTRTETVTTSSTSAGVPSTATHRVPVSPGHAVSASSRTPPGRPLTG